MAIPQFAVVSGAQTATAGRVGLVTSLYSTERDGAGWLGFTRASSFLGLLQARRITREYSYPNRA